jgi:predicted alpha/beta superfamily hydrolase
MLRNAFLLCCLGLCFHGCERITLASATEERLVLDSSFTDYTYEITVLLPPGYQADQNYPSVYLLDGHWHYPDVAADAQRLMEKGEIRDLILVGIAYHDIPPNTLSGYARIYDIRIDDFTFPKNETEAEWGGKAADFRRFLGEELIPEVESRYATSATERTLMGHSLGGYFGFWEMFTHRDRSLFQNVEASSPALWWADGYLLDQEAALDSSEASLPFDLHTNMGQLESVTWNTFFDEMEARFEAADRPELTYTFERYPYGHTAMAEEGFCAGLRYFFGL